MNRESFLFHIKEKMESNGFQSDENKYIKKSQIQQPGTIMIINGRKVEQPGNIIEIEMVLECLGEGFVDEEPFELIGFTVYRGDETIFELNQSFYYNEFELFDNICMRIFKNF